MSEFNPVLLKVKNIVVQIDRQLILQNISFEVKKNECWAITGRSGSGKTSLGKVIAGRLSVSSGSMNWAYDNLKKIFVSQQHDFRSLFNARSYYQQRFDNNYGDEFPLVSHLLEKAGGEKEISFVVELLNIGHILDNRLIELSNGEGKRLQIALALLQEPDVLILDNPFIGLDKNTRGILHELIDKLKQKGTLVFLITSYDDIPLGVTHIIELEAGFVNVTGPRDQSLNNAAFLPSESHFNINTGLFHEVSVSNSPDFKVAVEMNDVKVQFNDKVILEHINWTVKKGEHWALTGPNGSGKSTLLSLINADNPQVYKNDIFLFDRKRGSGESIWDIKKKIGYISPELHIYFKRDQSFTENLFEGSGRLPNSLMRLRGIHCEDVVASGYNDQVGSAKEVTKYQERMIYHWLELLGVKNLARKGFYNLPLGEQRLVLLARALVKNPPMLILDEPCQGLDKVQTLRFKDIIDTICDHTDKTLIYVSHYPEDIPNCVQNYLSLDNGKIVS